MPAAPRYIECRLTELARTELFNDAITQFVPSYDGRNHEPITLPSKLPLTLMLGTEGIAVGLSARILPHNFPELIEAQVAILKKQPFKCLPDFQTGGLMDAREYADGKGSVKVRAKIKVKDESTVLIKEIPPTTTTESLIASIEDASRKGKIKVKSINDFTSEEVEIEVPEGMDLPTAIQAASEEDAPLPQRGERAAHREEEVRRPRSGERDLDDRHVGGGVEVAQRGPDAMVEPAFRHRDHLAACAAQPLRRFVIDSREAGPGDVFVAFRGEHTDGHLYVADAFQRGAVAAIVEQEMTLEALTLERNTAVGDLRVTRTDFPTWWFIAANHRLTWERLQSLSRSRRPGN